MSTIDKLRKQTQERVKSKKQEQEKRAKPKVAGGIRAEVFPPNTPAEKIVKTQLGYKKVKSSAAKRRQDSISNSPTKSRYASTPKSPTLSVKESAPVEKLSLDNYMQRTTSNNTLRPKTGTTKKVTFQS